MTSYEYYTRIRVEVFTSCRMAAAAWPTHVMQSSSEITTCACVCVNLSSVLSRQARAERHFCFGFVFLRCLVLLLLLLLLVFLRSCQVLLPFFHSFFFWWGGHHFYFPAQLVRGFTLSDLLDKPWSQVPSLLHPSTCLHFYRA